MNVLNLAYVITLLHFPVVKLNILLIVTIYALFNFKKLCKSIIIYLYHSETNSYYSIESKYLLNLHIYKNKIGIAYNENKYFGFDFS